MYGSERDDRRYPSRRSDLGCYEGNRSRENNGKDEDPVIPSTKRSETRTRTGPSPSNQAVKSRDAPKSGTYWGRRSQTLLSQQMKSVRDKKKIAIGEFQVAMSPTAVHDRDLIDIVTINDAKTKISYNDP